MRTACVSTRVVPRIKNLVPFLGGGFFTFVFKGTKHKKNYQFSKRQANLVFSIIIQTLKEDVR
ncbi:hypothetical protein D8M04_01170 [Oceanobacillus piezotolerans]|uniref:Uncharacterized protein n=1 Tax=Oceanobacillus piezotolerans TaxID=2448030 RepID=A0A498DFE0_9BACI|nr:hypothetical protein D8M04_01170 [Oceanobacillus piezotolerans]